MNPKRGGRRAHSNKTKVRFRTLSKSNLYCLRWFKQKMKSIVPRLIYSVYHSCCQELHPFRCKTEIHSTNPFNKRRKVRCRKEKDRMSSDAFHLIPHTSRFTNAFSGAEALALVRREKELTSLHNRLTTFQCIPTNETKHTLPFSVIFTISRTM